MELLATLLIVLFIVLLVGGAFAAAGMRGPWPSVIWLFVLLFFATLAIGVWAQPVGPQAWGVPWLPFLVVAILIALLIVAATPEYRYGYQRPGELPPERDTGVEPGVEVRTEPAEETDTGAAATATAIGIFFWIFLVLAGTVFLLSLLFAPLT